MAKLVVDQLDLSGKRVFLRADFTVPLEGAIPELNLTLPPLAAIFLVPED